MALVSLLPDNRVFVAVTSSFVLYVLLKKFRARKELPLPPGPSRLPLIGSVHNIPSDYPWIAFKRMADEQYGDVMYFEALGKPLIILGSAEAAKDLLERRSSNYSTRPQMIMLKLMGFQWSLSTMTYGEPWAKRRKLFNQYFSPAVIQQYEELQLRSAYHMLFKLLTTPDQFVEHVRCVFGSSIMKAVYGIDVKDMNDPYIHTAEQGLTALAEAAMPGRFLVDVFPWLMHVPAWFPGLEFKNWAAKASVFIRDTAQIPWNDMKTAIKEGTAKPCIATKVIEDVDQGNVEDDVARDVTGIAYAAGADTVRSAPLGVLAKSNKDTTKPDNVHAQAELDEVVGPDRLPDFTDIGRLPYCSAIVKELMRWMIVAPLSFTHSNDSEDEYKGYRIPKGSMIMVNAWGILHDPKMYPNPSAFEPERYIQGGKYNHEDILDPETIAFGFGRRVCPGRYFSNSAMMIVVASVLSVFDIGSEGHLPPPQQTSSIISHPVPFQCTIKPRSRAAEQLIHGASNH